jgi:hypothetical protein
MLSRILFSNGSKFLLLYMNGPINDISNSSSSSGSNSSSSSGSSRYRMLFHIVV